MNTLHQAAKEGNTEKCRELIQGGALVDENEARDGWTPLRCAVEGKHALTCEVLVLAGAQVDALDKHGWSPMRHAVFIDESGGTNLMQILVSAVTKHAALAALAQCTAPEDSCVGVTTNDLLSAPGTSYWLQNSLKSALTRDPVDAAADAELLAKVLTARADAFLNGSGSAAA